TDLESLSLDTYKEFSPMFENDVYEAVNLDNCVNRRTVYGGPSAASVDRQIKIVNAYIDAQK
ncbi:MAG: argininosuccinate lyase, partial [Clostridia bacterium]|nr:argininosuccinate lyase [Clostridia bacterium]